MKKIFYLIITLSSLTFTNSIAQVAKGKFLIGGLINPSFMRSEYSNNNYASNIWRINSQIRFGYFLTERFNLGLDLQNYNSIDNSSGSRSRSYSVTAGPLIRYYFINKKFGFFGEGGAGGGIGWGWATSTSYDWRNQADIKFSNNLSYLKIGPGINYFLKENVALEVLVTYQRTWATSSYGNSYENKFRFHLLDVKVGLIILL